ncbi:tRNA (adenosine(37)-N6)-threonylcarbamoyltransferase complex dimerization subunit type 1 TsaB [Usitatibacter palustris]|uniref:tRNA (adenosine(37)-N6)-threonylcarbamoyltransferase complex dimerization subunit type 1 TsaB n=1 Tax=Usitatibacter palustris TaxID=2732487 RepID=UPI00148906C4|nr:tRNA (adenosine(37)-N6)-threonylcarbamoyltransferase complex dimerization subunit type 1 TsaB [Usitatibacter palustris]
MNVLAIETSTELCSAAVLRGSELFVEETVAANRHSELLVPMVQRLLERSRLAVAQMNAIAFGQGPGSFTGIRIACGMAQGLAFGAERPVVPVPSLLALAEQSNESRVIAAFDARMDEAYLAAYARSGDDWQEVIAPCLVDRAALPSLPGRGWVATGSGFDRFDWLRTHYRDSIALRLENDLPRAGSIARVAARRMARGESVAAEQAAPLYLRDKVALTTEERQARR